ncbi:flagellar motor switch protein [uncultured Sulfitobacter sp.]|uniref:flagellar motor switch protein n=1 Tax=uncultured Sulfitobacter sp. TaxID=191468 RepID=UPI0030FCCF73
MLPALIDVIIVVLLIGTLVYAYILDRRVRNLMLTLREMGPMVGEFSNAVEQSTKSVEDLRSLSTAARRVEPPVKKTRQGMVDREQVKEPVMPEPVKVRKQVRGQTSVPGKSDLVRTFFDITKERKE